MWWSRTFLLVVVAAVAGGCGFQPLYGTQATGSTPAEFAQIKVEPIVDRLGQQLHNHLLTILNPDGRPAAPRYRMNTTLTEGIASLGVRKSAFATRANLTVNSNYRLTDTETGKIILSDQTSITVSYNILESEFATLMAEKDARSRAVRELAESIRIRLGVFFARQTLPDDRKQSAR